MTTISELLASYPRTRPELPKPYRQIYEREYRLNRNGEGLVEGLARTLDRWLHANVATLSGGPLLELGAGTLNHVSWEIGAEPYDVVEPMATLHAESPWRPRVRSFYESIHDVPRDNRYHRIVSVAALEHMTDLPAVLSKAGLMLEDGGVFQAGIPSEGGLLWWLGWRMTTGLSFYLRNRLNYGVMMRHEHVSTAPEIVNLVRRPR